MSEEWPLILSMDTATKCSTVAITRGTVGDGEVLGCLSLSSNITHSRRLNTAVDHLFQETGTAWPDIDGIGVGMGPGSFTGLRIGMATAKGFAVATEKKLLGVSTLDALAAMCVTDMPILAVIDARKQQVYSATYQYEPDGKLLRKTDFRAVSPEQVIEGIDEEVVMVGDALVNYGTLWKELLKDRVRFAPVQLQAPTASAVGLLCGVEFQQGKHLDIAEATPMYVRASDAELSLNDRKKQKGGNGGGS